MHSLSDRITRLRNAQRAGLRQRTIPLYAQINTPRLHSHLEGIKTIRPMQLIRFFEILRREGYIQGFRVKKEFNTKQNNQKTDVTLIVDLKYKSNGVSGFRSIFIVSTAGRRVYLSTEALWQPQSTIGTLVISTPLGLLTDREAREKNIGGEVLFGII